MEAISQVASLSQLQTLVPGLRARVRVIPIPHAASGGLVQVITAEGQLTNMVLGRPDLPRASFCASLVRFLRSPRARGWQRALLPLSGFYERAAAGRGWRQIHRRIGTAEAPLLLVAAAWRSVELRGQGCQGCMDICYLLQSEGRPQRISEPEHWLSGGRVGSVKAKSPLTDGQEALAYSV